MNILRSYEFLKTRRDRRRERSRKKWREGEGRERGGDGEEGKEEGGEGEGHPKVSFVTMAVSW